MGLDFIWLIVAVLVGGYLFIFKFLKNNVNECISFVKLGKKAYKNLPPGELGWPLVGSSISFLKAFTNGDPDSFHHHFVSRYGEKGIYKTHLYGRPTILVTDGDACCDILRSEKQFIPSYPTSFKKLLSNDISAYETITFELHKPIHKLISSLLSGSEALSSHIEFIEHFVINAFEEWASMKTPIELNKEIKALTLKIICKLFLGAAVEPYLGQFQTLYLQLMAGVSSIFPYALPGSTFYRAVKARGEISKIISRLMQEKEKGNKNMEGEKERKCLLKMVMEARDENGGKLLEDELKIDLILMLVLGGEDTSACAAMWAMRYLSQNPEIFRKAKEEQELIVKKRPSSQKGLSFEETKQMKYLEMVINETLRITTVAFTSFREAREDISFHGYTIPKGWNILSWYRGIHMNPLTFPNPQNFDPSRWDNIVSKRGMLFPFGYGYRYCCGSELANLELTVILHHFLLSYKLELLNPKCKVSHLPIPMPRDKCLSRLAKLA